MLSEAIRINIINSIIESVFKNEDTNKEMKDSYKTIINILISSIVYKDGTFMMYDDDHLSGEGSTALFRQLKPQFETILNQRMPEK
jgi:hypothetical protein